MIGAVLPGTDVEGRLGTSKKTKAAADSPRPIQIERISRRIDISANISTAAPRIATLLPPCVSSFWQTLSIAVNCARPLWESLRREARQL